MLRRLDILKTLREVGFSFLGFRVARVNCAFLRSVQYSYKSILLYNFVSADWVLKKSKFLPLLPLSILCSMIFSLSPFVFSVLASSSLSPL